MSSILKKTSRHFQNDGTVQSMATIKNVIAVLSRDNDFMEEVLDSFSVDAEQNSIIQVGNVTSVV